MGNVCSISISSDQAVSNCWNCTVGQANHICKLEENLRKLTTSLEELLMLRNDVRRRVDIAERQQMKRLDQVQWWLSRVEAVETVINQLIIDREVQPNMNCLSKYMMGKKIPRMLAELNTLKTQGKFEAVVDHLPPALVEEIPCNPTAGLQPTFDSLWSQLQNDEVGIIGLYGMAGVGKTTLLIQMNNEFIKKCHNFELVIWIVVSKNLIVEKIQDDIARRIGCCGQNWSSKSQDEKAMCIFRILCNKRFVLLFDDLWERIDLQGLGVPFPKKENRSKLVFTTRSKVVCCKMEAQTTIKIECLGWDDAWHLFREKVGEETFRSHPEIPKLSETVAKRCGGLPLALITIGRAMACKTTPQGWSHAIEVLKKSTSEFSGMEDEVFSLLKFSYDNLSNDTVKSCFLYCALFPEDFIITKIDLVDYWIGDGILDRFDNIREARNCGFDIVETLIDACLLEDYSPEVSVDSVKMHDVIRDMALWIASDYGKSKDHFVVQAGAGLNKAPDVQKWKPARRISLMNNNIENLTEVPVSTSLLTLLLKQNNLTAINDKFFKFMHCLMVLDLSNNMKLTELPSSISKLVSLEYLNLSNTGIRQLPIELTGLVKLKYLNLNFTSLDNIGHEIMSSLRMLEVLKMASCLPGSDEAFVENLESLKCLDYLILTIRCLPAFQMLTSSQMLQNCTQCIWIHTSDDLVLDISCLRNMKRLIGFHVTSYAPKELTVNSALLQANNACFYSLTYLFVVSCPELRDLTWVIFAPNLMLLEVVRCDKMEEVICHDKWGQLGGKGTTNVDLFRYLKKIRLDGLPSLKSIYWETLQLPHLKYIHAIGCQKLKKLPLNSSSGNGNKIVIKGSWEWWNQLEWEDEAARNAFLPFYKSYFGAQSI